STAASSFTNLLFAEGHWTAPGRMLLFVFPLFILTEFLMKQKQFPEFIAPASRPVQWGTFYLLILVILIFGVLHSAPQFIYFQF
ncbi:MAG TPA: hypothetical protein VKA27_14755, partial [Sunxiuqinia sp.]|nr:hypothetical protein [Sunxiuqinia sp.]